MFPDQRGRSPHDDDQDHDDTDDVADLLAKGLGPIALSEVNKKIHLAHSLLRIAIHGFLRVYVGCEAATD